MHTEDFYIRRTGVLLHPTSLPSGKLDGDVERWLAFLQQCDFSVWQVLPLGEPQIDLSPYQCVSAFALNPVLLDEYPAVDKHSSAYQSFCEKHQSWLFDYALFKILKSRFQQAPWYHWPDKYKFRDESVLHTVRAEHQPRLDEICWQQFCLYNRWQQIKTLAATKNILLFGDIAIFVAHDSVDVWACPQHYLLDENGMMTVVAGVPPDYFSATGQRWGNPHYNWDLMQAEDFSWWVDRLNYHFELFDLVRIDHFIGLDAVWMIPAEAETAIDGYYQKVPGKALLETVRRVTGHLPLVAEDLGIITDAVRTLKHQFHLPGMAVLQFGFDEHDDNPHKIKNIHSDCVVYTGTHDNDTTLGWYQKMDATMREKVLQQLGISYDKHLLSDPRLQNTAKQPHYGNQVVDGMIQAAMHSAASLCVFPLQDCLHLGSTARMNIPGTENHNWTWRFKWEQINAALSTQMKQWVMQSNREQPQPVLE